MLTPPLLAIGAGTIELTDARSGSRRAVTLSPFEIGRTAVTGDEFRGDGDPRPVHGVTWFDVITWCNALSWAAGLTPAYRQFGRRIEWRLDADGYRLPTQAEWEFAARAGSTEPTHGPLEEIAWSAADGVEGPQAVGLKAPNAFGLFDAIGNVWEWCWNYADTARYGDYRSLRGGGWADPAYSCRASVRRGSAPDAVLEDVGFRVARGSVGSEGSRAGQGWSHEEDRLRADVRGPRPMGWTPLREIL